MSFYCTEVCEVTLTIVIFIQDKSTSLSKVELSIYIRPHATRIQIEGTE